MHLTLLSRSQAIYTTQRLCEAGAARGHNVRVLDPLRFEMHLDGKSAHLFYQRDTLPPADVVIPRIAQSINTYGLAVLNQFELRGTPVVNRTAAIAQSRNKMRCLQLLSAHGIAIPATVMASRAADLKAMVELVGGVPVLIRVIQGGDRRGVMVCESLQSMEAALEALLGLGHNLVIQQYVLDRRGRDIRALVVGGQVVAAARRKPRVGRLSRTLAQGATLQKVKLPPEFERLAVRAAELVGLDVAAVDMLDLTDGPRISELNASPGLRELEQSSGQDLAGEIITYAERLVRQAAPLSALPGPAPRPAQTSRRKR